MSSLREAVTLTDWADSMILLFKSALYANKILLVLEGETDISFFNANAYDERIHFDSPCCGKPEVIKAVNEIRSEGNEKCYGICDADFDNLSGIQYENIYLTDFHDLEMMLIAGGVVDRFIDMFTKHSYIISLNRSEFKDRIKKSILEVCYSIGILKWLNYNNHLLLRFKSMRYADFVTVNKELVEFNLDGYIQHVISRSGRLADGYDFERIKNEYQALLNQNVGFQNANYLNVCNGHDFMYILSMVFQGELSTDRNMNKERVETHMRIGYHRDIFRTTGLYNCIEQALVFHA